MPSRRKIRAAVAGALPAVELLILVFTGFGAIFVIGLLGVGLGEGWLAWDEAEGPIPAPFSLPIRPVLAREYLGLMIRGWFQGRTEHFRANVMLWDPIARKLGVWAAYGMDDAGVRELALTLFPGQGCAGQAFVHKRVFYVDLAVHRHEEYGVQADHVWAEMRSILSMPILHGGEVVGILSVDSDLNLADTGFAQRSLYEDLSKYATMIFGNADVAP